MTVEMRVDDVMQILKAQADVIEQQTAQIKSLSRAPSEASMQVDRFGIDQLADHCQKLTLDALQETEKMVKYRGKFLRESEFNAIEEADAEEPTRPVAKGWYRSEMTDVHFKKRKYVKGKTEYTCEECDGWWVKTGSAPTTHGSTEIASPAMSTDQDAVPWEKVSEKASELPEGVLQEWQLRPMTIPQTCSLPSFECGLCGAKWVLSERITAPHM